ncbi:hypothetical protein BD311DRAFT_767453 [Dichomitus squalens]|uniref:Uncharacterized protein n=1 Tax=Dichomitus squalens TaxID=114155 RepID=A0A4Q9ME41_9APHY|nr:hypothetical protein BD311DRAFT_767453 [Dichomitus squalens]
MSRANATRGNLAPSGSTGRSFACWLFACLVRGPLATAIVRGAAGASMGFASVREAPLPAEDPSTGGRG